MDFVYVADDGIDSKKLIRDLQDSRTIGLDTEATSLDPFTATWLLLQLKIKDCIYIVDVRKLGVNYLRYIAQLIKDIHIKVVGHNIKYDVKIIHQNTGELLTNLYDTMIAEVLINQGVGKQYYGLDELISKYLDINIEKDLQKSFIDYEGEITNEQLVYSALDVQYLFTLKDKQEEILESQGQTKVLNEIENPLIAPVVSMEENGVLIDEDHWRNVIDKYSNQKEEFEDKIKSDIVNKLDMSEYRNTYELANALAIPVKTKKLKTELELLDIDFAEPWIKENFLISSHNQVKHLLNLYGCNVPSTGEKVIKPYRDKFPVVSDILSFREAIKRTSTYGENMLSEVHPKTGRLHVEFNQVGTHTGRFSVSRLQQIPAEDEYRRGFIAHPLYQIMAIDYCLPAGTKVLKSDLSWVNIEDLNIGDGLVSIDEYSNKKYRRRSMKEGFVEKLGKSRLPCYEIELENGKKLISSEEHPWLATVKGGHSFDWIKTKKLKSGCNLSFFVEPWEKADDFESGYLSGMFDGEGSINNSKRGGHLVFYQVDGPVLELTMKYLNSKGFNFTGPYGRKSGFSERSSKAIYICGIGQIMRFLGEINPIRLYEKQKEMWVGRIPFKSGEMHRIKSIKYVGYQDVITMQTSTHTFLADGYWSHNSQQEYRLAGDITKDERIIESYLQEKDMHTSTGALLYGVKLEDVTKEQRAKGKTVNFAILYGTTVWGLMYNLGITQGEAEELLEKIRYGYPRFMSFVEAVGKKIFELKYSKTLTGRRRFFEDKKIFKDVKDYERYKRNIAREGWNHMIQGTGADIIKYAMINIFYQNPFNPTDIKFYNNAHDELVLEIIRGRVAEIAEFVKDKMLEAEQAFLKYIPAKVDYNIGDYWIH